MLKKQGAKYLGSGTCKFCVWAPFAEKLKVVFPERAPGEMKKKTHGYWEAEISGSHSGQLYKFELDGKTFPDPASRYQPEGVHSWSQVSDPKAYSFQDDDWTGIPISEMIIYELHVGTFTPEGTFAGVTKKIDYFKELGINTLEIMPISPFPGNRNWGYDGVYPFGVQNSYGSIEDLKKLIDTCHENEIAVLLDVVYNHLGPEGNYSAEFGPYFTEKYHTPWGAAINYDDRNSDVVRDFFLQAAVRWLEEFHFDGLRLDAVQEIIDRGAYHFLQELRERVDVLERKNRRGYVLIAESDLNDSKFVKPYAKGGFGLEAQWVDDFHHSLHTLLTGENQGYYSDYGKLEHMAKAFQQGFVYDGIYSKFRQKNVGNSPAALAFWDFVVCIQNHDQVGNRLLGDRISSLVSFETLKLAAGMLLISPYVPMLFMGEEFAEENPFQYFVSHGDPKLVKAVQKGRKREFNYFFKDTGDFPDPQAEETFEHSKLNWDFRKNPTQELIFKYYKNLIGLRKKDAFEAFRSKNIKTEVLKSEKTLLISAEDYSENSLFAAANFGSKPATFSFPNAKPYKLVFASAAKEWDGPADFPKKLKEKHVLPPQSLLVCKT